MESFQFSKEENQGSSESFDIMSGNYDFTQESLVNIPYPEDNCMEEDGSLSMSEDVDLPPPPGAVDNEPLPPFQFRSSPAKNLPPDEIDKIDLPSSNKLENKNEGPLPPFPLSPFGDNQPKSDQLGSEGDLLEDTVNESKISDDSKYSPSKVESDDENQDAAVKPKVLGKEQAKKRLMAFSLSKQMNAGVKKQQNKVLTPVKSSKEKPPNPNKSTNVQEQFRATITAIEEEKRKMMQNMPTYLLMEMSDLAKSTQAIPKSIKTEENEPNKTGKDHNSSTKSSDAARGKDLNKRSSRRSRSRSRSANRSKRRRRSRSKRRSRSGSPSRRRSRSRNRRSRSRSRTRKIKDEKERSSKTDKKEKSYTSKKDLAEDWKMFKSSGLNFDSVSDENNEDENSRKRSPSPKPRQDFKPIFSYLKKENKVMAPLRARPADHNKPSPILYPEKYIKYTKAKPFVIWSENLSCATEFCMPKEMLLENCDQNVIEILQNIIESKNEADFLDAKQYKSRPWYPRQEYLSPMPLSVYDDLETDSKHNSENESVENHKAEFKFENSKKETSNKDNVGSSDDRKRERTLSLVNDSYLSDEDEKLKEVVVGDLKVQMDVGTNSVKVCSRWDSDYEDESNEMETKIRKKPVKAISAEVQCKPSPKPKKMEDDFTESKKSVDVLNSNKMKPVEGSDLATGNLVSEYEEFLKMVSFDSSDKGPDCYSNSPPKSEIQRSTKPEEESKRVSKIEATDWDQESEDDETSPVKKVPFSKPTPPSLLIKNEKLETSKKKSKKVSKLKKKVEKSKLKKSKSKKDSKTKKKKYKDSSSSESSSDSYDSDSSSDSDDKKSKKRKKKKVKKIRKKSRKNSSSDSDSDSEDDKPKKKKTKKKKKEIKKKKDSESEEDENQASLLQQLDFKKQLIMKKIEEIDFISERSGKKKEKDPRQKKKEISEELSDKCGVKKKTDVKSEKNKKKSKSGSSKGKENKDLKKSPSSSESSSESPDNKKKKKAKKEKKKKRHSSESSDEEEKSKKEKLLDIKNLKSEKKVKKAKKKKHYSTSESSDDSSDKAKKKTKKSKSKKNEDKDIIKEENSWKENVIVESAGYKVKDLEEHLEWESRNLWDKAEKKCKVKKEGDDWEASSSLEATPQKAKSRESSWDDEVPPKAKVEVVPEVEEKSKPEAGKEPPTETLKTSLSNFSFNENSFCSFGQELSRDFFLADRSLSNSIMPSNSNTISSTLIESRPFQSVSKNNELLKPSASELYSPGHSDSDLSETEINDKTNSNSNAASTEVYDPLNCDSEGSVENNDIEVGSIPLPQVSDILLPGESKSQKVNDGVAYSPKSLSKTEGKTEQIEMPVSKTTFTPTDFNLTNSKPTFGFEKFTPSKKQIMSVKSQPKLKSKAASVFQDESDDENVEEKEKAKDENVDPSKTTAETKEDKVQNQKVEEKKKEEKRRERDRSRERSSERERKRKRSSSLERRESRHRGHSPRRRRSKSPDFRSSKESKTGKSDYSDIDTLKNSSGTKEMESSVQPITVVTGLGAPLGEQHWNRSHLPGYTCNEYSNNLMDSFDIYPSEDPKIRSSRNFEKDWEETTTSDKPYHRDDRKKKESRRSRSRSVSPRKRRRSKSPDRRRSPKRRSRERSPYSPRRRSPKRRGSPRRYRGSRSPERRRKSRSRSPRRRRESPRRSRSMSPRKHRSSPKRRVDSPRRRNSFSPRRSMSPRKDGHYSSAYPENSSGLQGRIPVIGVSNKEVDSESGGRRRSPRFEHSDGFSSHVSDPTAAEDMSNSFYGRDYNNEFGYSEDPSGNNLITVKNHDDEKVDSPERLTLDQRIELELGVRLSSASGTQDEQYAMQNQQFQDSNHFNSSYSNDGAVSDNFYPNHGVPPDFSDQYFNGTQPGNFSQFPPPQTSQSSVMQVGNIMEVVPAMHHPPPLPPQVPSKPQQIMQVGNVLQVVPSPKAVPQGPPGAILPGPPMPPPQAHNFGLPATTPLVKTQKATAVVAPSSIVPTPNPEAVINPLIKAIQIEREKRRKEKEKRKAEREARRRARQLRREAKLMSVNEKLKKSVVDEGLMLGQEVEDDELLDSLDLPSPPVPVEIITVSSQNSLPPAGKGILISAGFVPKPASEKKEVKFADGVLPGEGTSSSAGEEIASPPPKPKLPKEKRFKKKKTKVKKKVKVQIIKQIIQDEDDDDDDDLSPPPPPPGDPPPVFFARFPFAGDAQFPVYQTQTTTTTLTTVQFPAQQF